MKNLRTNGKFTLLLCSILCCASCKKAIDFKTDSPISDLNVKKVASINLNSNEKPSNPLYVVDSVGKNVQFFKSTFTAQSWGNRMKTRNRATHSLPTGLYLKPNTGLTYKIELISGTEIPRIVVGTFSRISTDPRQYTNSTAGTKTITDPLGGIIWVDFDGPNANSEAKITFENGHSMIPVFIKNKTTQQEWEAQITNSHDDIPDVLMLGNRTVMVYSKDLHPSVATQDNNKILNHADFTMDIEDYIAGFDDLSYNHTKHPAPHLMVHGLDYFKLMSTTAYRSSYSHPSGAPEVFSSRIYNSWGMWHELGHMHQQSATSYSDSFYGANDGISEVTVNVFTLAVEKALGITPSRLQNDIIWPRAFDFINSTSSNKNYDSLDVSVKLILFNQLSLAYGDAFYIKYHRSVRDDNNTYSGKDAIKRNIIKKACLASGYDLSSFFIKWAFLPNTDPIYAEVNSLNLPQPIINPYELSDDFQPDIENGGIYKIHTPLNSSKVLDVNGNNIANNSKITLYTKNNSANNQKFLARIQTDGSYVFKSLADTTKVMTTMDGSSANGTQVVAYDYSASNSQKWIPEKTADNFYKFKSKVSSNRYLDVTNSGSDNGTAIIIWSSNNGNNQKFRLVKQ